MSVSLAQLKSRVDTDLPDSTLVDIISAETEAVNRHAGNEAVVENHNAYGQRKLVLLRKPASISSITERITLDGTPTTLVDGTDYRALAPRILYRIDTYWGADVVVTYTAEVDQALRDRVVLDLCQLAIEFSAYGEQEVGDWTGDQDDYHERREGLLKQLREPRALLV